MMKIDADEFQEIREAIDVDLMQACNGNLLSDRDWTIRHLEDAKVKINDLIKRMKQ